MSEESQVTEQSLSADAPYAFVAVGIDAEQARGIARIAIWGLPFLFVSIGLIVIAIIQGYDLGEFALIAGVSGLLGGLMVAYGVISYRAAITKPEVDVTCSRCGHAARILASRAFVRCQDCGKLQWLPRTADEISVVVRCVICDEVNTLPAGSEEPVHCPNCQALLQIAPDGTSRLVEAEQRCPQCDAQLGASNWICPKCLHVLQEERLPPVAHPTDKAFIHGIGPTSALTAGVWCLEQARGKLRKVDLNTWDSESLDTISYLIMACFYLFRAASESSIKKKVLEAYNRLDEVYALLLLHLYYACQNLSESQHQGILKPMNNRLVGMAFYRARCEEGLQQQGLIGSASSVEVDRWLARLPVRSETHLAQKVAAIKAVYIEQMLPGLGALSYITRERDRAILDPEPFRIKSLELLGSQKDLSEGSLRSLYEQKIELATPIVH